MHICSGYFTQVSEPWPVSLLLFFLAHLSQRLRMSYCDDSQSVIHLPTPLNKVSEIPGPIFFKFHMEPSVNGGLKIYTNAHGPLIKMAAMTRTRTKKASGLNLGTCI